MYEFLLLLSVFLVFAYLVLLIKTVPVRKANAGSNLCFVGSAKPAPTETVDPVPPFELVVQELKAARRARAAKNMLNAMRGN